MLSEVVVLACSISKLSFDRRYLDETIQMLPDLPGDDLISRIWRRLTALSSIRVRQLDRFVA